MTQPTLPVECGAPGCYRRATATGVACSTHWARVHPDTKAKLKRSMRTGIGTAAAMADAVEDMTRAAS